MLIDGRRLLSVSAGAGLFALALLSIRRRSAISIHHLIGAIAIAGLAMFAVRVGLDQIWPDPRTIDRSLRWALAWTGYFGIWLLAVTRGLDQRNSPNRSSTFLPKVYLEQLFGTKARDQD